MVQPTYPGVYIEEVPASVRTITGVATSITAFVGRALRGPTGKAIMVHSFSDYERLYGGLWKESSMSYAVYQYFLNGGLDAIIVRLAKNAAEATFTSKKTPLKLKAANPGLWGEDLVLVIAAAEPDSLAKDPTFFNLIVQKKTLESNRSGSVLEEFHDVSLNPASSRYIEKLLVDGGSSYLRVDGAVPSSDVPLPPDTNYQSNHTGSDGSILDAPTVIGDQPTKTGIYALENVDLFNLLCIPEFNDAESERSIVYNEALTLCKARRAMLIVDPPRGWLTCADAKSRVGDYVRRDPNGAIYFPRIIAPDQLDQCRLKDFDPCGAIAGVIARTDSQRGVWKAPAGVEATLVGVFGLALSITDKENGELNRLGINCLRIFPDAGQVVWGSRTLRGADELSDQWKYLPVRRMALYIEESLYRGTQWVVFEPNEEKSWSQIRISVGAFMQSLFLQGAFQGTTPKNAYFVKCDRETTTQDDIKKGIVNIVVGFAPLKPAEFIIIKIQQIAGQISE